MRDFQKSKVYRWENSHVFPKMSMKLQDMRTLEIIRDHMWAGLGLSNPPKLFIDPDYKTCSTGNRYEIRFMECMMNEGVLVHEMGHSLNRCEHRDVYDHHGPNFVADYCRLLTTFYGFDINYLQFTLKKEKVKIDMETYYKDL